MTQRTKPASKDFTPGKGKFFQTDPDYSKKFFERRKTASIPADAEQIYFTALTKFNNLGGPLLRYLNVFRFHDRRDEIAWYDPNAKNFHFARWLVSPDMADLTGPRDVNFIAMHEILHHFLGHASLTREFGDLPHSLVNIGADIVINNMLLTLMEGADMRGEPLQIHKLLYFKRDWSDLNEGQILNLFRAYTPLFQTLEDYTRNGGAEVIKKLTEDAEATFDRDVTSAALTGLEQHKRNQSQEDAERELAEAMQNDAMSPDGAQGAPGGQPSDSQDSAGKASAGQDSGGQGGAAGQPSAGQGTAGQPQGPGTPGSDPFSGVPSSATPEQRSALTERAQDPAMAQSLHDGLQQRMEGSGQNFSNASHRADAMAQAVKDHLSGNGQNDLLDQALNDLTRGQSPDDSSPNLDPQKVAQEFQNGFEELVDTRGQKGLLQEFEEKFGELNVGDYMTQRALMGQTPGEVIGDVSKNLPKHYDAHRFLDDFVEHGGERLKGLMSGNGFMKTVFKRTKTINLVAHVRSLVSSKGAASRGMLDKRQDVHDGIIMPSIVSKSGRIALLIDTSGSQSNEDVMDGLNAAYKSVMTGNEVTLIFNDAERYNHVRVRTASQLRSFLKTKGFVRWGGSVFRDVFTNFILKKNFDKVIFVTDLYIDAAELPRGVAEKVIVLYTHDESAVKRFVKDNPSWKGAKFFPISLKQTVVV
jgi:hypothetical protein